MPAAGGDSLTNGSLFIFTDPAVSGCDEGPASLLGNAFQRLQANDLAACDAFSAALGRGQEELGGPTPLERVRLGFLLGIARLRRIRIEEALSAAQTALRQAAALPWPAEKTLVPTHFSPETAQPLYDQTRAALHTAGLLALPTGGALLGLTREGRLLPTDKDLDLLLPHSQIRRAGEILMTLGWRPCWTSLRLANLQAFLHPGTGTTLDLIGFLHDRQRDKILTGWWLPGFPLAEGRLVELSMPRPVAFFGPFGFFWKLENPETWVAELFGPFWRTPDPGFDTLIETPALVSVTPFTRCVVLLRLLEAWLTGHRVRFLRLFAALKRRVPAAFNDMPISFADELIPPPTPWRIL